LNWLPNTLPTRLIGDRDIDAEVLRTELDQMEGTRGLRERDADVDPAELQAQLDRITGAMGFEEQHPGRARLWLVVGVLVGLGGLLVQVAYFYYETLTERLRRDLVRLPGGGDCGLGPPLPASHGGDADEPAAGGRSSDRYSRSCWRCLVSETGMLTSHPGWSGPGCSSGW